MPSGVLQKHYCHVPNCTTVVEPRHLMCPKHWVKVPKHIQRKVYENYREGQCNDKRPSLEWIRLARLAINVVKELETK